MPHTPERFTHEVLPPVYPGMRFEPGIHPFIASNEWNQIIADKFTSGDLNAHQWNNAVKERMSAYQPQVISIDGQAPSARWDINRKGHIWLSLPGRPNDINHDNPTYVVAGDFYDYTQALTDFSNTANPNVDALLQELDKEMPGTGLMELFQAYGEKTGMGLSGGLASMAILAGATKSQPIARREFLKYASEAVLGLALSWALPAWFAPVGAAVMNNEPAKDLLMDITTITGPYLIKSDYLNARTAMLIAKTQDSIDYLGLPTTIPSSVLMGAAHTPEAAVLMTNPVARTEVIAQYTGDLVKTLNTVIRSEYPALDTVAARKALLDHVSRAQIIQVTDPGGPSPNPQLLTLVDSCVSNVATIQSPQIEQAISHLRK